MLVLQPFQRRFLRRALAPETRTAALSLPRGNGKTTLIAELARRVLTPGDPLHRPGTESHIVSKSVGQSRRTSFKVLRQLADWGDDYRIADSQNGAHITHLRSRKRGDECCRVSVLSADPDGAQGLVRAPFVFADEPGAWLVEGGREMHAAIQRAMGKPGAPMTAFYVGTLAGGRTKGRPAAVSGWWHDLATGGDRDDVHAVCYQGHAKRWRDWRALMRCNPLMAKFAESRARLRTEREAARRDPAELADFLSFRLNVPTKDETEVVLSPDDWERVCGRPVPDPDGRPAVGVDLGGGRAWSAAVAVWQSGRVEAVALAPGTPSLIQQEIRDRVPRGTYTGLAAAGLLQTDGDRRVPRVEVLLDQVRHWDPAVLVCDRFRHDDLLDAGPRCPVQPRIARWSESSEDLRAFRAWALDGELAVEAGSRGLLGVSLAASTVECDDQGNSRIRKGSSNTARDDVAVAAVLAAGEAERRRRRAGPYEIKVHVAG